MGVDAPPQEALEITAAQAASAASTETAARGDELADNLPLILDVPVHVTAELGRTMLPVGEVLGLTTGSVVEFERQPGEPVDILVNGQAVARGDVVIVNDRFAVRITALTKPGGVGESPMGPA